MFDTPALNEHIVYLYFRAKADLILIAVAKKLFHVDGSNVFCFRSSEPEGNLDSEAFRFGL